MTERVFSNPLVIERGLRLAMRSVCAIEVGPNSGTGVLIGPDLVLTNYHVVGSLITTRNFAAAECRFGYADAGDGQGPAEGETVEIREIVAFSPPSPGDSRGGSQCFKPNCLDYAIVRIDQPIGTNPWRELPVRGWITLPTRPPAPEIGARIHVLQHPGGVGWPRESQPLRYSIGEFVGTRGDGARVMHDAKTASGSSGGPCFDNDGFHFVALHNARTGETDDEPRQAVPLAKIVGDIRAGCPTADSFVGKGPPEPPLNDRKKEERQQMNSVRKRIAVARCLIDRVTEEARFLASLRATAKPAAGGTGPRPLLNVIIARPADAPEFFFDRLRFLPFDNPEVRVAFWRDALRKGLGNTPPRALTRSWPPLVDPAERADELWARLDELDPTSRQLLIMKRTIDPEWDPATERDLIASFAASVAEKFSDSPDNIRVIVAFVAPDGKAGNMLAQTFGSLWKATNPPPHCGFCLSLREIENDDVTDWRDCLGHTWGHNSDFNDRIDTVFRMQARLPLGHFATEIDESLTSYLKTVLKAATWDNEALQ